jgi:hypothetical protein
MTEATRYVVLCACEGKPTSRIIAWIDDDRINGGDVSVQSNVSFTESRHPDGHLIWNIRCRACRKWVPWSEATVADVIDKIAPIRDRLELRRIPALSQPRKALDEEQREERQKRHDEIMAQIRAEPSSRQLPQPGPDAVIPNATHYEMRHVIPLITLCNVVTALRNDT